MEECDYEQVEKLIAEENYKEAQAELDKADVRPARWHFLQGRLFYKKSWFTESRKQLEIAVQLEPDNTQYIEELGCLNELGEAVQRTEKQEKSKRVKGTCKEACGEACCLGCGECLCQGLCEAICNGCN